MVAFVGIYAISRSAFDLCFLTGFGVMGYVFRKADIPLVPVILGMLLGPEMEKNLRHVMQINDGNWLMLWHSGLATGLWIIALAGLILPWIIGPALRSRMRRSADWAICGPVPGAAPA